jgi:hypothetical protein
MSMLEVCNTPAILSFDPFPNYESSASNARQRRKRQTDNERKRREDGDDNDSDSEDQDATIIEHDRLDLEKLRQQVDDVLHKVRCRLLS